MIDHVSIGDIAIKIAEYRDFRITHEDIVEWARAAMMAANIPKHEVPHVVDLLQDISCSTGVSMRRAIEEHTLLLSRVHRDGDRLYFDS
jgi:hypothetical protein